jgi:hypothetical protein
MTAMTVLHELSWKMKLGAQGYTCFELVDGFHRRWGWVINAGYTGWTAHVGDYGQAAMIGMKPPPVNQDIENFTDLQDAKDWVEQEIADGWKDDCK